jgi:hypothetical protein
MWPQKRAENRAGQQKLQLSRKATGPMPAVTAVEELVSARPQEWQDVLQVGGGARCGPQRRPIQWATHGGEERNAGETAADLEAARPDVLVREAVTREVDDRPQQERR